MSKRKYEYIIIYRPSFEIYSVPVDDLDLTDEEIEEMADDDLVDHIEQHVDYMADYYDGTEHTGEQDEVIRWEADK